MNIIEAIIIAIVEGLTEFLPVSSTGHMIVTSSLLGIQKADFTKLFEIAIQLGAILAVVVLYWRKFFDFRRWQFYVKLIAAVIPALLLGFLFSDKIDTLLESPTTVAITMLLGGIVLLFIDKAFKNPQVDSEEQISFTKAIIIGCWQCLAMIPGVSRSAASVIGGMQQQLSRSAAAEFSFFLAVPTMCAATGYKLLKYFKTHDGFSGEEIKLLAIGNITAFIVAVLAIKFFINYLKIYGFRIFGIYRIIAGLILLALIFSGIIEG
jgi:undecaprenyl-diphosphatase